MSASNFGFRWGILALLIGVATCIKPDAVSAVVGGEKAFAKSCDVNSIKEIAISNETINPEILLACNDGLYDNTVAARVSVALIYRINITGLDKDSRRHAVFTGIGRYFGQKATILNFDRLRQYYRGSPTIIFHLNKHLRQCYPCVGICGAHVIKLKAAYYQSGQFDANGGASGEGSSVSGLLGGVGGLGGEAKRYDQCGYSSDPDRDLAKSPEGLFLRCFGGFSILAIFSVVAIGGGIAGWLIMRGPMNLRGLVLGLGVFFLTCAGGIYAAAAYYR